MLIRTILCFIIDPFIFTFIPGDTFIIGISIVMGVYVFGLLGVIAGPLITGVTCTMFEMYREYIAMPAADSNENVDESWFGSI